MSPRKAAALRNNGSDQSLREHLIATAAQLIAVRGTVGLTVREIARAAAVADGVLYNHFADKEQLLALALGAHLRVVEQSLGELPVPGVGSVADNLRAHLEHGLALHRAVLPAFAGLLGREAVLRRFAETEESGPHWRTALGEYLRAERDLGRLAPETDIATTTAILVGICHDAVLAGLLQHIPETPIVPDQVVATLLRGIGVDTSAKRFSVGPGKSG